MKIKSGFVLHQMVDEYVVVAVGERTNEFKGLIRLNHTGAFLWNLLVDDTTTLLLVEALIKEYKIDEETALKAVDTFIKDLTSSSLLEL